MIYFLAAIVAFGASSLISKYLSGGRSIIQILDEPNHRSLHSKATPRVGGIGILLGTFIGVTPLLRTEISFSLGVLVATAGLLLVAGVSFWDDRRGLSQRLRLSFQAGAAVLAIFAMGGISRIGLPGFGVLELTLLSAPFTFLFIIWMMNLYNFMDGMDGFAGGMGVIGFAALSLIGWMEGAPHFAYLALILSVANLGFLSQNFPPAKIFMGDVGAVPMGYLVAVMTIWGVQRDIFEFWVPVLIFAPFILDATATLIHRAIRREKFWLAHSSHYYQRLVKAGWGHKRAVVLEYALMLACAAVAVILNNAQSDTVEVVGLVAVLAGLILLARLINKIAPMPPIDRSSPEG